MPAKSFLILKSAAVTRGARRRTLVGDAADAPHGRKTRQTLIRLLGVDAGDVAVPARAIILDQLGRGGAARAGDREQRVEEMRLVLAGEIAAGASVQPLTGDVEDFESDIAHRAAAVRRIEASARRIGSHCD